MTITNEKQLSNSTAIKKILSILLALISVVTMFTATHIDAQAATWRTGNFDTGYTAKGYTTIYLTSKKGKLQNGKIKVYAYDKLGYKTNAKLHIVLRTTSGKWICEFNTTSGSTLKLGNDHYAYRVYISPQKLSNSANDFLNMGKCVYWGIQCTSNTTI